MAKKTSKKKSKMQKGGQMDLMNWPYGGTDGDPITFFQDLTGIIVYGINTLGNTAAIALDVAQLPYDMSVAFGKNEPNPSDISITNEFNIDF